MSHAQKYVERLTLIACLLVPQASLSQGVASVSRSRGNTNDYLYFSSQALADRDVFEVSHEVGRSISPQALSSLGGAREHSNYSGTPFGTEGAYSEEFDQMHRELMTEWIHEPDTLVMVYDPAENKLKASERPKSVEDQILIARAEALLMNPSMWPAGRAPDKPLTFYFISGVRKVLDASQFGSDPYSLVSRDKDRLYAMAGAGGAERNIPSVYMTKEFLRDVMQGDLINIVREEAVHALEKAAGHREPETFKDNPRRPGWLTTIAWQLRRVERYRRGIAESISMATGADSADLEGSLKVLDHETLLAAYGRRQNLISQAYKNYFQSAWNPADPLAAIRSLAAGVRGNPVLVRYSVYLSEFPSLISDEIPESLKLYLAESRFMKFGDLVPQGPSYLSIEWRYQVLSGNEGVWVPSEVNRFSSSKTWEPMNVRVVAKPLRPAESPKDLQILDVKILGLTSDYLREKVHEQWGRIQPGRLPERIHDQAPILWVFTTLPATGHLRVPAPNTSRLIDRAAESLILQIGPDGVPLSLLVPGSMDVIPLEVALLKNDQGQITQVLGARYELLENQAVQFAAQSPSHLFWHQGAVVGDPSDGMPSVNFGTHIFPGSTVKNRSTYEIPGEYSGQLAEALRGPLPVFVRVWGKALLEDFEFFTKRIEIWKDEAFVELFDTTTGIIWPWEFYRPPGQAPGPEPQNPRMTKTPIVSTVAEALKYAWTLGGHVVISGLSVYDVDQVMHVFMSRRYIHLYHPAARFVRERFNARLQELAPSDRSNAELTARVHLQSPEGQPQKAEPFKVELGVFHHQDPNRYPTRLFDPLASYDVVPREESQNFSAQDPTAQQEVSRPAPDLPTHIGGILVEDFRKIVEESPTLRAALERLKTLGWTRSESALSFHIKRHGWTSPVKKVKQSG